MYVRNTNIRLTIWNTYFLTYTHNVCDACVYYAHRHPRRRHTYIPWLSLRFSSRTVFLIKFKVKTNRQK